MSLFLGDKCHIKRGEKTSGAVSVGMSFRNERDRLLCQRPRKHCSLSACHFSKFLIQGVLLQNKDSHWCFGLLNLTSPEGVYFVSFQKFRMTYVRLPQTFGHPAQGGDWLPAPQVVCLADPISNFVDLHRKEQNQRPCPLDTDPNIPIINSATPA